MRQWDARGGLETVRIGRGLGARLDWPTARKKCATELERNRNGQRWRGRSVVEAWYCGRCVDRASATGRNDRGSGDPGHYEHRDLRDHVEAARRGDLASRWAV